MSTIEKPRVIVETLEILGDGEAAGSTHLAAERLARQRIAAGRNKEQAHAR